MSGSQKVKVSIIKCDDYDRELVYQKVKGSIDSLGGMVKFVSRGDKVLIKPNLLSPRSPDKAVLTHPAVLEAVVRLVIDAGGKPVVGDSPGFSSPMTCAEKGGFLPVLERYNVPLLKFEESVTVRASEGSDSAFKVFDVARDTLTVDKIINLPKLKTHAQMVMTMAVKNTFGVVVGGKKSQWHLRIGNRPEKFARMLLDLHYLVNPVLSIMDGITAMEGNGPGNGDPVELGLVFASSDATALDAVALRIVGLEPSLLYTLNEARKAKMGVWDMKNIDVVGEDIEDVSVTGFAFPPTGRLLGGMPSFVSRVARRVLTPRPVIDHDPCIMCGQCEKICGALAISSTPGEVSSMDIDYNKCIRCFCCQEICPEGAISVKTGWFPRSGS